ncbi:MAG: hypothetical protein RIS92_633 [Verrucomicrobiota bacterium]|jgi:hypothetical protein
MDSEECFAGEGERIPEGLPVRSGIAHSGRVGFDLDSGEVSVFGCMSANGVAAAEEGSGRDGNAR